MGKPKQKRSVIESDSEWDNSDSDVEVKIISASDNKRDSTKARQNIKGKDARKFESDSDLDLSASEEEEEDEPSNIVERVKIDKKLLNAGRKVKLDLSDDDDDDDSSDGDDDVNKITINEKYAAEYTKKKEQSILNNENQRMLLQLTKQVAAQEREERRQRLKEKREQRALAGEAVSSGDDDDDDLTDYSTEDEFGDKLIDTETDKKIFATLNLLRKKDPSIYDKNKVFFESQSSETDNDEEEEKETKKPKKEKKLTIGRFMASLKPEELEDEASDIEDTPVRSGYHEEQMKLKKEFFESLKREEEEKKRQAAAQEQKQGASDDDEESDLDDFLGASKKVYDPSTEDQEVATDVAKATETLKKIAQKEKSSKVSDLLHVSALGEDELKDQASFLESYITNEWWRKDEADSSIPDAKKILGDARGAALQGFENEEYEDKFNDAVDRYEAEINFRFEEAGANELLTFPRNIEGSMRKKNETRKLQRQRRLERQRLEKQRKEEEIKRLKNATKKAIEAKLRTIAFLSDLDVDLEGNSTNKLTLEDITTDFDPKKHEERMRQLFGDEFYNEGAEADAEDDDDDDVDQSHLVDKYRQNTLKYLEETEQQEVEEAKKLAEKAKERVEKLKKEKLSKIASSMNDADADDEDEDEDDVDDIESEIEEAEKAAKVQTLVADTVTKRTKETTKKVANLVNSVLDVEASPDQEAEKWYQTAKQKILSRDDIIAQLKGLKGAEKEAKIKEIMAVELEKLYDLDQEDVLMGTKYQYIEVPPANYGLEIEDILNMSDSELNQKVSMKKLAPYRKDVDDNRHWKELVKEQKEIYKNYQLEKTKGKKASASAADLKKPAGAKRKADTQVKSTKHTVKSRKTGWLVNANEMTNKKIVLKKKTE